MSISAFTVSYNLFSLGYVFIESALSVMDYVDEYVVLECGSKDDTLSYWKRLQTKHKKIRIEYTSWPTPGNTRETGNEGGISGKMQDLAMSLCRSEFGLCCHADEVWHPDSAVLIPHSLESNPGAVSIPYLHLKDNFQREYDYYKQCFTSSEMLIKLEQGWKSDNDGWRFWMGKGNIISYPFPKPLYHVGYVFPINLHKKNINHAKIYSGMSRYQKLAEESKIILETGNFGPDFDLKTSPFDLPPILRDLVGVKEYYCRDSLFL